MTGRVWKVGVVALTLCGGCVRARLDDNSGGRTVIDEEQIIAMRAVNAYDVVSRTHAEYLHSRGRQAFDPKVPPVPAHVFLDDTYYGDVSTLSAVPASQLSEIRFYQSYEAQYKFGSGHMGGVIQLITKR